MKWVTPYHTFHLSVGMDLASPSIYARSLIVKPGKHPRRVDTSFSFHTPSVMTKVDYSLYLVTDNTKAILGDRDIFEVVEAALEGGL